jgi:hypothetical protein
VAIPENQQIAFPITRGAFDMLYFSIQRAANATALTNQAIQATDPAIKEMALVQSHESLLDCVEYLQRLMHHVMTTAQVVSE